MILWLLWRLCSGFLWGSLVLSLSTMTACAPVSLAWSRPVRQPSQFTIIVPPRVVYIAGQHMFITSPK